MSADWTAVIGTAIGGLVTGSVTVFGIWLSSRSQLIQRADDWAHQVQDQRRAEKQAIFVAYLEALHELHLALNSITERHPTSIATPAGNEREKVETETHALRATARARLTHIRLLAGLEVREAANQARRAVYRYYVDVLSAEPFAVNQEVSNEAIKTLESAMRIELGIESAAVSSIGP